MTPERWQQIQDIFHAALDRDASSRPAFLDDACAADQELRAEIDALLKAHREAGSFGDASTFTMTGMAGRVIGDYRLLQSIGQGGMGEVWLAEQLRPVRRDVAMKLIRRGMDSSHFIARFEAERQALARMDHPAIATVFDGGTTPDGQPYFVMEYVKGEPITTYCDRVKLSTAERLELFIQVCEGVEHAHQKSVIHRDLKPSNVLVTTRDDRPVPKIIDFGVAKAIAQPLTDKTLYTALGSIIGTPEYMSPEQTVSGGLDVDTRTDVYSLGSMLYELLTGVLPFSAEELRKGGLIELSQLIREKEPVRPSARITAPDATTGAAASCRRTEPLKLAAQLRGDLDWITMKAIHKDRTRRYGSASALAADIRHHLNHEPVLAGPPSATYRAGKFIRRHRVGVGISAVAALTLVSVAITLVVQAQRIAHERDRANQEAIRANREGEASRQVTDFLVGLFKVSDPSEARGNAVTAREILDKGAKSIESDLSGQAEVQGRLMATMATVYQSLGLYEEAATLFAKSLEVQRRLFGDDNAVVANTLHDLGTLQVLMGDLDSGEKTLTEALALRERLVGANSFDVAITSGSLGILAYERGDFARAESLFRRRLALLRATSEGQGEAAADALNDLAMTIEQARADYGEAKTLLSESLEIRKRVLGPDHPKLGQSLNNLAMAHYRAGEFDAAEPLFREALARNIANFGDVHTEVSATSSNLALVLRERGAYAEAHALWARALVIDRQLLGDHHPTIGFTLTYWGESLRRNGDAKAGEAKLREALAVFAQALPEDHWRAAEARSLLAMCLADQRRFAEAETLLLSSYSSLAAQYAPSHPRVAGVVERLSVLYDAWGQPQKAAEWRTRMKP
jgi:serine/threonine protein kinase/tetratricopeptide (TPR) repeat protein